MIKINFLTTKKGLLLGFDMYGHAGYDEHGYDIVCAAVSSAAFLTANTISEVIKVPLKTHINEESGMYLRVNVTDAELCRDVLLGFKFHMLSLEEQYPENIMVNYMEV